MIKIVKRTAFVIVLMALSFTAFSQSVRFRKVIGNTGYDYGYSAKQTFDKGYIIGGTTSTFGSGNTDMYAVKTDSMGIPYRHAMIGGINIDQGSCIRQTSDSGYVFLGYTNSYGAGGYDLYLVKMDSTFNIQWTKTYGGTDWDFGYCVEQTPIDGGYILCGSTYSFGNGDKDYYLIKTNSLGDTLWTKTYGGSKEDEAKSVVPTSDGGYILTGTTKSMGDTLGDFYTVKTNSAGDTTWTNRFGGAYLDYGNDVIESIYGGFIVGGETQSFSYIVGSSDGMIARISASGITDSSYSTGYSSPTYDNMESVTEDISGRIAMVGRNVSLGDPGGNGDVHFFLIKNDWGFVNAITCGDARYENGYSVEPTADKGFIICGTTKSFNNFLNDIYLIKVDSTGSAGNIDNTFTTNIATFTTSQIPDLEIFPNPADDKLSIYSKSINEKTTIKIFDIIGNELRSEQNIQNSASSLKINVSDLANGIYILVLSTDKGSLSQKLIIQH